MKAVGDSFENWKSAFSHALLACLEQMVMSTENEVAPEKMQEQWATIYLMAEHCPDLATKAINKLDAVLSFKEW